VNAGQPTGRAIEVGGIASDRGTAARDWPMCAAMVNMDVDTETGRVDVAAAQRLAERLLADLRDRWRHTVGAAARAEEIAGAIPAGPDRVSE
jgi:hypothetical protein